MRSPYDPKLREAAAEIQAILDKHDIGAFLGLFSRSHTEFKFHIEPSWSMMHYNRDEKGEVTGFRFKYRKTRSEDCDATAGMLMNVRDLSALFFQYADKAIKLLEQEMEIDHKTFGGGISTKDLEPPNAAIVSIPKKEN